MMIFKIITENIRAEGLQFRVAVYSPPGYLWTYSKVLATKTLAKVWGRLYIAPYNTETRGYRQKQEKADYAVRHYGHRI